MGVAVGMGVGVPVADSGMAGAPGVFWGKAVAKGVGDCRTGSGVGEKGGAGDEP